MTLDPVIQTMVDRLARGFRPQRIILFGSHARGTAQPTSDVDLLVILREVADKRRAAVEMRRALSDLPLGKDILVATPDDVARRGHLVGPTLRAALLDGNVVYEGADPGDGLPQPWLGQTGKGFEVPSHEP